MGRPERGNTMKAVVQAGDGSTDALDSLGMRHLRLT
jgi:hypothetical protein